jgi:hypothetical protein
LHLECRTLQHRRGAGGLEESFFRRLFERLAGVTPRHHRRTAESANRARRWPGPGDARDERAARLGVMPRGEG